MKTNSLILVLSLVIPVAGMAQETAMSCRDIVKNNDRLKCYDQLETETDLLLTDTILDERLKQEMSSLGSSFSLTAHRPSYILPVAYMSDPNGEPYSPTQPPTPPENSLDNLEVKFQISFRVPLKMNFIYPNSHLWLGYTQLSLWQLYNSDASAPFRETTYEPELIWVFLVNKSFGELKLTHLAPAINHQSNGRSDPLSRSWNRVTLDSIWAYRNWAFSLRPWYRLPDADNDDNNPDIEDYIGNFDFRAGYKQKDHQFSSLFRSTFDSDQPRSYYELGYSFSINRKFRGYVQFVNGYGESLIDYNHRNKRFSIGIMLNDWF